MTLSVEEKAYYARHFRLPGFTDKTQENLKNAKVLIIGMGGLGCPIAMYLAGAGVGNLTLCDADTVSVSNLHRQVLFDLSHVGKLKVEVAADRLRTMNPYIQIDTIPRFMDSEALATLVATFDVVVDGTDNFEAKYAINDACEKAEVPLVYGSIFQFEGQVSVFHYVPANGGSEYPVGYSYRDLYPARPPAGLSQNCGEAGVVGVLPGIIGTLQANEVIKIVTGLGTVLSGSLLTYDALSGTSRNLTLRRRLRIGGPSEADNQEISMETALDLLRYHVEKPARLVDVRELHEREESSLGGDHIPLHQLPSRYHSLIDVPVIVLYCKSGVRSAKAALYLRTVLPNAKIYSLQGGVDGNSCSIL